ncbi:hypothetical protein BDV41DRAFT_71960 [Aspergillus transmontanensis]|uniref:2EXR domain-containing protein n=1 Tax=Aspergillus transmontanensis TaxID=1034304 RepID=A0A5N6VEW7_9EURO|nr:hypothetical protein BDV41DRAFT_71960 [Aspergillus transmontanensis]
MATGVFTLFPNLPPELRNHIWRDTLPDKVRQALYLYKRGCWHSRRLTQDEKGYDHNNDKCNWCHVWRHDLLDPIQLEVPLLFVNSEARGIALAWIQEQGLKMSFYEDGQAPTAIRPFDPEHDTLYISLDTWRDFSNEPCELLDPRYGSTHSNCALPTFSRVAMPEELFQYDISLFDVFLFYLNLEKAFVIFNAQSDIQPEENGLKVQRRWELQGTQGPTLFWNGDCECFEWRDVGDETFNTVLERACDGLDEWLIFNEIDRFEVQAAFAVSK